MYFLPASLTYEKITSKMNPLAKQGINWHLALRGPCILCIPWFITSYISALMTYLPEVNSFLYSAKKKINNGRPLSKFKFKADNTEFEVMLLLLI